MAQGDPQARNPYRWTYYFINNVYADFFKTTLDYFADHLYPRTMTRVIATYDKAVEYLNQQRYIDGEYGEQREEDQPLLPALVMNPSGELEIADALAGGRFLWRHPNLLPGFVKYIFDPIYQDANVTVNVGFLRMKGSIELLALMNSFYEYADFRLLLLQIFGGMERWIYPQFFSSFIVLPQELINYQYRNPETGLTYRLNWRENGAYDYLVRSTAREELVMPCEIKPIYKMVSMGDNTERYGGTEKLADWRLTTTFEYEVEIPAYLVVQSDYLAENVQMEIKYGSVYTQNPVINRPPPPPISNTTDGMFDAVPDSGVTGGSVPSFNDPGVQAPPVNRQIYSSKYNYGLDATSASYFTYDSSKPDTPFDSTCSTFFTGDYLFKVRYYHVITQAEEDADNYVDIDLPETIADLNSIIVWGPYGQLNYGDHYRIINGGNTLRILKSTVNLKRGWIIELFVYKRLD